MMRQQPNLRALKNIFPELSSEAIDKLLNSAKMVKYARKHMLCRQGEIADTFYILIEGTVGVYLEIQANDEIYQVDRIRQGCFGEVALLLGTRRTAYIISK